MGLIEPFSPWDEDSHPVNTDFRLVRGTAVFAAGVVLALTALLAFVWGHTHSADSVYLYREIAIAFGMFSLPLAFLGIVLTLPSSRLSVGVTLFGLAISLVAIVYFIIHYPHEWNVSGYDAHLYGTVLYALGVLPSAFAVLVSLSLSVAERTALMLLPEEVRSDEDITQEQIREYMKEEANNKLKEV